MNIKMTTKEFDQFLMIYLKDRIEGFDEMGFEDNDLFYEFIEKLKKTAFWPLMNRSFLDTSMTTRVQSNRIIDKKPDSEFISILI